MSDTKVIDTKVTLTWLISTGILLLGGLVTLIWGMASTSNKIDQVLAQQSKTDARMESGVARVEALEARTSTAISDLQRHDDKTDLRLDSVERAIGLKIPLRK